MILTKFQRSMYDLTQSLGQIDSLILDFDGDQNSARAISYFIENLEFVSIKQTYSKYSKCPEVQYVPLGTDDSIATINVEADPDGKIAFNYNPIFWNAGSILKILDMFKSKQSGIIPPYQTLVDLEKGIKWNNDGQSNIGLASPKEFKNDAKSRHAFNVELTGSSSEIKSAVKKYFRSTLIRSDSCIELVDVASGNHMVLGNSSYPISRDSSDQCFQPINVKDDLGNYFCDNNSSDQINHLMVESIDSPVPLKSISFNRESSRFAIEACIVNTPKSNFVHVTYSSRFFSRVEAESHFLTLENYLGAEKQGENRKAYGSEGLVGSQKPIVRSNLQWAFENLAEKVAIRSESQTISYGELASLAAKVSSQLNESDELVAVIMGPSVEFVATTIACIANDITFFPIDPNFGDERIRTFLSEIPSCKVITNSNFGGSFEDHIHHFEVDLMSMGIEKSHPLTFRKNPSKPIYRIYTSGSTGKPKGIDVKDSNLTALFQSYASRYEDIFSKCWPFLSSVSFDAAVKQYIGPLAFGGSIFIPRDRLSNNPLSLIKALQENSIGILNATPTMVEFLLNAGADLAGFKNIFLGGEMLSQKLVDRLRTCAPEALITNLYGPSETTINALAYDLQPDVRYSIVPIGTALNGCRAEVVETDRSSPIMKGQKGELVISGDLVTDGYVNTVSPAFYNSGVGRTYATGDICFKWHDDMFYFLGREDSQVKVKGIRVDLGEIEALIQKRFTAISCYVTKHQETIYIALHNCERDCLESVREWVLGGNFGSLPLRIFFTPSLPLTVNGKVNTSELIKLADAGSDHKYDPESALEAEILIETNRILSRHNLPKVSPTTDLVSEGMDSLATMELMVYLAERYPGKISTSDFLEARTVRNLCRSVDIKTEAKLVRWSAGAHHKNGLVILLPPVLGKGIIFSDFSNSLSEHYGVAICDYPDDGHLATIEEIANKIYLEITEERCDQRKLIIVGYSMGASVGYVLASLFEKAGMAADRLLILDKAPIASLSLDQQLEQNKLFLSQAFRDIDKSSEFYKSMVRQVEDNTRIGIKFSPEGIVNTKATIYACRESNKDELKLWSANLAASVEVIDLNCLHNEIFDAGNHDPLVRNLISISSPGEINRELYA